MINRRVRQLLLGLCSDADFEGFCLDYFKQTHSQFTAGMDRTARINLLLGREGADAVTRALTEAGHGEAVEPAQTVFQLIQSLTPEFTGRQGTLCMLKERLSSERHVALWGLGGLGKTQTALAYAHRHRDDYQVVLGLSGDSTAIFEQGLFDLGRPLHQVGHLTSYDERDPVRVRRAVLEYLRHNSEYLLIVDNVDAPSVLRELWPGRAGLAGQVLLTSRSRDCRKQLGAEVVELGKLSHAEATAYLRRCHPPRRMSEEPALEELATELDGLPLALAQAVAFLMTHDSRYDTYLRQYRKQPLKLLDEQNLPCDYPSPVATTWAMSIERVMHDNPASLELLNLCALLHPDAIPEALFTEPVGALGETLCAALANEDELSLDRTLRPLLEHALVQRDRQMGMLSLHRLVQQVVLYRMSEAQQQRWAQAAVAQLEAMYPRPEFSRWPQCRLLLSQVPVMVGHVDRFGLTGQAAGNLLNKAGWYFAEQAQYGEAESLFRRALTIREKSLGGEHPDVAGSLNNLGIVLKNQRKDEEAEPLFRRALTIREKTLGDEHPEVAVSLNNLGLLLEVQEKYEEAELLYRRALVIKEKALGSENSSVASSLNNLGVLMKNQGKYGEAELLYQRALAIFEKVLGSEHPDVAGSLNNLGLLLEAQGRDEESEHFLRRSLAIREKALSDGHPLIDRTRIDLERLLAKNARLR